MMKTLYSVTAFQFSLCVWFFMKSIVNKLYWVYWVKCILRTYHTIYQKKDLFKKIVSDWLNIDPPWSNLQLNSLILINRGQGYCIFVYFSLHGMHDSFGWVFQAIPVRSTPTRNCACCTECPTTRRTCMSLIRSTFTLAMTLSTARNTPWTANSSPLRWVQIN